jgi:hypothetical protein
MPDTQNRPGLVLEPALAFGALETRLRQQGWTRRPSASVTGPIIPGEPELAQWRLDRDGTLLTYTFNPVVHLRVLHVSGGASAAQRDALAQALPTLGVDDVGRALDAGDARTVLRGILAAAEIGALDLADRIGLLAAHREPAVAQAAARVHLELLHAKAIVLARVERPDELSATLSAICGNAWPLLAALPGATADQILGLQPMEEDCREVFAGDLGAAVFEAYDQLWTDPPTVSPGPDRRELQIRACPAVLFGTRNRFSNAFPAGFQSVAPYLRDDRVWLAWRYCAPGSQSGLAFDGLVHVREHWVWFPKVYQVVPRIIGNGALS